MSGKQPGGSDRDRKREWNHRKPWKLENAPQFKTRDLHLQIAVVCNYGDDGSGMQVIVEGCGAKCKASRTEQTSKEGSVSE